MNKTRSQVYIILSDHRINFHFCRLFLRRMATLISLSTGSLFERVKNPSPRNFFTVSPNRESLATHTIHLCVLFRPFPFLFVYVVFAFIHCSERLRD